MKRSKLFKRASSLVTALLVFSMCFAGMACAVGGTITAGTATVTAVSGEEGLYEVTVPYTSSNVGSLGVTLLAFSKGSAAGDAWTAATAPAAYTDDMQIVGIDQTEDSGSIKFVISTNSTDSIKMAEGETGVILLGGDGVSTPSKTTFTVPSNEPEPEVWVADKLTYSAGTIDLGEIEVPEGATDDDKKAAVIAKAQAAVKTGNQTFTYVLTTDSAKSATKALKNLGDTDIAGVTAVKTAEGAYDVTLTIAADVLSDDNTAKTGAGLSIVIPVTASFKTVTTPAVLYGDVNGDGKIDGRDLIRLGQYLADWDVVINEAASDANGDDKIDGRDLIRLGQYLAEWDVKLGK